MTAGYVSTRTCFSGNMAPCHAEQVRSKEIQVGLEGKLSHVDLSTFHSLSGIRVLVVENRSRGADRVAAHIISPSRHPKKDLTASFVRDDSLQILTNSNHDLCMGAHV